MAERDESSGLQAFKYDGRLARFSTQHSPSASSRRARGEHTVAGRVGQTAARDPGQCALCGGLLQIAIERWTRRTVVSTPPAARKR